MKKFQVLQGVMRRSGSGDYTICVGFDTKQEAMNYFDDVKNDTQGWHIDKRTGEYLHTIVICGDDYESFVDEHITR